ncbi:MAG: RDD family protein [Magnetospirillum sp.]|nr:MAG: RDD family protein [Magnetospirillum sp.]
MAVEDILVIPPGGSDRTDPWKNPAAFAGVTWRRVIAYLIDAFVVALMAGAVWVGAGMLGLVTFGLLLPLQSLLVALVPLAYHTFLIAGPRAATLGMRAFDLRVESLAGGGEGRPAVIQALVQTATFYASVGMTGGLILLVALFNARRRTLHDFLAGTMVVNVGGAGR